MFTKPSMFDVLPHSAGPSTHVAGSNTPSCRLPLHDHSIAAGWKPVKITHHASRILDSRSGDNSLDLQPADVESARE